MKLRHKNLFLHFGNHKAGLYLFMPLGKMSLDFVSNSHNRELRRTPSKVKEIPVGVVDGFYFILALVTAQNFVFSHAFTFNGYVFC